MDNWIRANIEINQEDKILGFVEIVIFVDGVETARRSLEDILIKDFSVKVSYLKEYF